MATQGAPTLTPSPGGATFRPRSGPIGLNRDATSRPDAPSEPPRHPERAGDAGIGEGLVAPARLAEEFGGARLLASDMRVGFMLINHARNRTVARLFGASRDQANLVTLVAAMVLADTVHERIQKMLRGPSVPSLGDGLFAGGSLRELLWGVAGPPARDTPLSGTLLTLAVLGGTAGPAAFKSIRAISGSSRRIHHGFRHRYGYLVDPGHWRARRATRRSRSTPSRNAIDRRNLS